MDGAGRVQAFFAVTLPMLTPTIFFNLVLSIIATFQTFTSAFVATNGGPLDSTLFYVLYLYRMAFQNFADGLRLGTGLDALPDHPGLTLLVVRSGQWWVYYEGEQP
jgi:multiple sugar transport system permease protein